MYDHEPDEIDEFFSNKSKAIRDTSFHRCLKLLENDGDIKGLFKYNSFLNSVEFAKQPFWDKEPKLDCEITDNDIIQALTVITKKYNFSPTDNNLIKAITYESFKLAYHPIKNYLNFLQWDGVPRLDFWLTKIVNCDDNIYTRAVSRKVLCAAVARVYNPGCKFDYMPILEGEQRIKKSTLVRMIAGDKYFTTVSFSYSDKEIVDILRGKWIVEVDEMSGFSTQEDTRIKSLLSKLTDRQRLSYGRFAQDFKRQSIFIATKNPDGDNRYFSDQTGNTRYWPIQCKGKVNTDLFLEMRDQLFAEAVHRYREGEGLWLDHIEVEKMAIEVQEERKLEDPLEEKIGKYLFEKMREPECKVTVGEIIDKCLNVSSGNVTRALASRVGRVINKYKWVFFRQRVNGEVMKYYYPPGTIDPVLVASGIEAEKVKEEEQVDWSP